MLFGVPMVSDWAEVSFRDAFFQLGHRGANVIAAVLRNDNQTNSRRHFSARQSRQSLFFVLGKRV